MRKASGDFAVAEALAEMQLNFDAGQTKARNWRDVISDRSLAK